ncbi:MAG: transposase [Sphingobacteriales bacterium]|nr:transposase [Sphingobacteriales bacterium]
MPEKSHVKKKKRQWRLLKNFHQKCINLLLSVSFPYKTVNLYFQDESRFGMFTRNGKILTSKGIKPICPYHQVFKSTYLFGSFSPLDGDNFLMEMSLCNAQTFQVYLNELSKHRPSEYKILVLDNAAFHKAKKLNIPENIGMIFLPPYSLGT